MSTEVTLLLAVCVFALAACLLAWLLMEIGTAAMVEYRARFTERVRFQAREFFLFIDPRALFAANVAAMLLVSGTLWMVSGSAALAVPVFFAMTCVPRLAYGWMRRQRMHGFEEQLPDALLMLSGGLRAGSGLMSALQLLVQEAQPPLAQEFAVVLREQRLGVTLDQALDNLARRMPNQSTVLVVSAMRIATETGGGLAEALERTATTIRSRLQMEGKIDALTAQGKLQAWVVGGLPLALLVILNTMEPESMRHLWHTPMGWAVLAIIAFLEVTGVYVIRRIVSIDV
ncbi:MAG TPA: type II secretion system F family protein [Noviherbaspirillum sp.]|jgi:tight adherence protein B|uniref:type II secretion system F family protein n=1 Tax=Noviherbaspirillum sp. TaxID=1926288 RepID=UPI002F943FDF